MNQTTTQVPTDSRLLGLILLGAALSCMLVMAAPLRAQNIGVAGHASTLGVGGEVTLGLSPQLGVRGRVSVQPWEPNRIIDEVDVTASFSSPVYSGFVDFYPFGGSFHLTGGLVHFSAPITLFGTPVAPVEVNGSMYDPSQIGDVEVEVQTKERAPYAGIGFGRPSGYGFGMFVDMGVVFQGEPTLNVQFDGPFANDPTFQQNLDVEIAQVEDDISSFKYYPVLSIGLRFGAN